MGTQEKGIELGQRYRAKGTGGIWRVTGMTRDHAGNLHAQLMLESDATRTVAIAFAALADRRFYERIVIKESVRDEIVFK